MTFIPDAYLTALKQKRKQRVDEQRKEWAMTPPPKRICPFCCRELGKPEVNSRGVVVKDCPCGWIRLTKTH